MSFQKALKNVKMNGGANIMNTNFHIIKIIINFILLKI